MTNRTRRTHAGTCLTIYLVALAAGCAPQDTLMSGDQEQGTAPTERMIEETITTADGGVVTGEVTRVRPLSALIEGTGLTASFLGVPAIQLGGFERSYSQRKATPSGMADVSVTINARGEIARIDTRVEGRATVSVELEWAQRGAVRELVRETQHYFWQGQYLGKKVTTVLASTGVVPAASWATTGNVGSVIAEPEPPPPTPPHAEEDALGCCGWKLTVVILIAVGMGVLSLAAVSACAVAASATGPLSPATFLSCMGYTGGALAGSGGLASAIDDYNQCRAENCPQISRRRVGTDPGLAFG